jgi:hypothetical protein
MNVELYVGTLTRYYSQQWENAATRAGAKSPFQPAKNKGEAVTDPIELQGVIAEWLASASTKLKEHLPGPLSWQEGMLAPYFVGDLGFAGYGGAVLLTAYTANAQLQRPVAFVPTWEGDPAIEAALKAEKKDALWEVVNCGLWLPVEFRFGIGMKDPSGTPLKAGSIDLLWAAIEYLNEANWGATPEEIAAWRERGLHDVDTFETQSQFGYSVFYEMCKRARENRLPMKLHY